MSRRPGFTLIELLVAMGIVAVLAAILFPMAVRAKKSAMRARCQSNLTQIAKAFEAYTSDWNSCYPNLDSQYLWGGFFWREPVRRYIGSGAAGTRDMVLACPSDPTPPGIYAATSYAYSASFYMTPEQVNAVADPNHLRRAFVETNPKLPCASVSASYVRFPSKKVLVTEYWTLHSDNPKVGWYDSPAGSGNDPWSGSRNYLFADGHVAHLATTRIKPAASERVSRTRSLPDINLTVDGVAGRDID